MMIDFHDFFPQTIEQKGFFAEDKYENFSSLLTKVNQWLSANQVKIITIETVVLREIDDFVGEVNKRRIFAKVIRE